MKFTEIRTQEDVDAYMIKMRMRMALITIPVLSVMISALFGCVLFLGSVRHDFISAVFIIFLAVSQLYMLFIIYRYYWNQ